MGAWFYADEWDYADEREVDIEGILDAESFDDHYGDEIDGRAIPVE